MDNQIAENLLVSALEGGSNYWYQIKSHNKETIPECKFLSTLLMYEGGEMEIMHEELDSPKKLKHDDVLKAWKEFSTNEEYERHYSDAINGNDDAVTGDIFFQILVIGKVIYS